MLAPGVYTRFDPLNRVRIDIYDLNHPEVTVARADQYVCSGPETMTDHVVEQRMGTHELGLVRIDGRLAGFLAPGAKALYWRDSLPVEVESLDLSGEPSLSPRLVRELLRVGTDLGPAVAGLFVFQEVAAGHVGLLRIDGRIVRVLQPGLYGFVRLRRQLAVEVLDLRVQSTEVSGQRSAAVFFKLVGR